MAHLQSKQSTGKTAIVIGGSMAGLLAARVLADRFEAVYLLERDNCPKEAQPRKGVPQGQHAHALLPKGLLILEELFPGLVQQLMQLGAVRGHGRFFAGGGYLYPVKPQPGALYVSRPLLETEVRARLLAIPHVCLCEGYSVMGLLADESKRRVCGVRARHRPQESQEGNNSVEMRADLVVDAGGRGSRMGDWLQTLGYPAPEVEWVEVNMGYATRYYRREAHHLNGDLMINIAPTPEGKRACGMMAQEGNRWIVTLAGYFGDYPPTDEAGFLAFAQSLPTPDVYELIRTATPLSEPVAYKFPSNQRRHFERLTRFPDGLLVIGDALCSFTPIYGQGMSVAALEAMALRDCLAAGDEKLAARFFQQVTPVVDTAWSLAAGNDQRLAGGAQKAPLGKRLIQGYLDRLLVAARSDPAVAMAFLKVGGLLEPPSSILHPSIVWRVTTNRWRRQNRVGRPALAEELANV